MDEVPIKAGRKSKGKMRQTYFWAIYGEQDGVACTWSPSRDMAHAKEQLGGIKGSVQQPIIYEALGCYEGLVKTWFRL